MATSKISRNHFIPENTKEYSHLNYIFFKIVPLCNNTLLPATVKLLETFLRAILLEPSQLFCRIRNVSSSITKAPSFQCWFQLREQVKVCWSHVRQHWRCSSEVTLFFTKKYFYLKWPVCWSIVVKEKPYFGSPIFWALPSTCNPKATKNINVHFFIHSRISCKLYRRISETFWSYNKEIELIHP